MELRGFEPLTFCMPCIRDSSDGVAVGPVPAGHQDRGVRGRRAKAGGIWPRWHLIWHWIFGCARMIAQLKEQIGGTDSLSRDERVPRSPLRADGRAASDGGALRRAGPR